MELQKKKPVSTKRKGELMKEEDKQKKVKQRREEDQEVTEVKVCICGSKKFFFLHSKACDGNHYETPGGVEGEGSWFLYLS